METEATPLAQRVLTLRVQETHERWVGFQGSDAGPGIAPEVAGQLFRPFFTTRSEGMGLGLSLCRTVIEQHGGALDYGPAPTVGTSAGAGNETSRAGTESRFTCQRHGAARGQRARPAWPVPHWPTIQTRQPRQNAEAAAPRPVTAAA